MSEEAWARHPTYVDYDISTLGRVRRATPKKGTRVGHILSPRPNDTGYLTVVIGNKPRKVHALVLETFVGPRPLKHDGCHNDGDRTNNALPNLRWATRAENMADARAHGTYQVGRKKLEAYWDNPENRAAQAARTRAFTTTESNALKAMRAAQKAALARPEVREKMRAAKLGKKQSPEAIAKRIASMRANREACA